MSPSSTATKSGSPLGDFVESKAQPLWHVVVLNVVTMSAYSIVWFWKTWRDLADHANAIDMDLPANPALLKLRNTSPILRTMGVLVPIWQLYLTSTLFSAIAQLYPAPDTFAHKNPIATGMIMTLVMFGCMSLYRLPGAFMLLFLLYVTPLVIAQKWLNDYWKTQEPPNTLVRQAFSAGELASLILGAVLLGLIVTHFAIMH
ncbi:MAG: DUF4234 domain-containing protein [Cyanobacteria bacterium SZAS LIN-5]|nr:DUF4234 domain-containing protein [Cyanobacteria bacterium SZAS LIN-5]RTL38858.1 MAG: hypothetical protein EKK48_20720 [Candidatus Melainabacteria bacterium]